MDTLASDLTFAEEDRGSISLGRKMSRTVVPSFPRPRRSFGNLKNRSLSWCNQELLMDRVAICLPDFSVVDYSPLIPRIAYSLNTLTRLFEFSEENLLCLAFDVFPIHLDGFKRVSSGNESLIYSRRYAGTCKRLLVILSRIWYKYNPV